jgi:PDZ domain-containing protein GIPC
MPFFGPKKSKSGKNAASSNDQKSGPCEGSQPTAETPSDEAQTPNRRKLLFHCQLAHGSPTGIISDFVNVRDLYRKIAECYDIDPSEVDSSL